MIKSGESDSGIATPLSYTIKKADSRNDEDQKRGILQNKTQVCAYSKDKKYSVCFRVFTRKKDLRICLNIKMRFLFL